MAPLVNTIKTGCKKKRFYIVYPFDLSLKKKLPKTIASGSKTSSTMSRPKCALY